MDTKPATNHNQTGGEAHHWLGVEILLLSLKSEYSVGPEFQPLHSQPSQSKYGENYFDCDPTCSVQDWGNISEMEVSQRAGRGQFHCKTRNYTFFVCQLASALYGLIVKKNFLVGVMTAVFLLY